MSDLEVAAAVAGIIFTFVAIGDIIRMFWESTKQRGRNFNQLRQ
jgi:hypothetical protein